MTTRKLLTLFLVLAILLSATGMTANATGAATLTAQLESIAESYVENYLRTIYLYENHDLSTGTIKEYYGVENLSLSENAPLSLQANKLSIIGNETYIADLCENISTFQATAQYLKYIRSTQKITRNDFMSEVSSIETMLGTDSATVHVYSHVSFVYPDEIEPALAADNFIVSFVKLDDNWLIADIWAEEIANCGYDDILYNYSDRISSFNTWLTKSKQSETFGEIEEVITQEDNNIQPLALAHVKSTGLYNSSRATAYAATYASSNPNADTTKFVNANYYNFGSVNCMNFVSQCIFAGLGGNDLSSDISNSAFPMDVRSAGWYYSSVSDYTIPWTCADYFKYYTFGINSSSTVGLRTTKAVIPAGSTSFSSAVIQTGSVSTSALTASVLPGAALILNWTDSEGDSRWHAVMVWKATSLSFNDVLLCENSPMRKGLSLNESGYSNMTIYYIKPHSMAEDLSCGSYSSHNYVDGYLGCTRCNYTKLEVWGGPTTNPIPVNTTLTLTGTANATCYRMAIGIAYENESASWTHYYGVSSFSKSYTFTRTGLYTITVAARDVTDVDQLSSGDAHVFKIRVY